MIVGNLVMLKLLFGLFGEFKLFVLLFFVEIEVKEIVKFYGVVFFIGKDVFFERVNSNLFNL